MHHKNINPTERWLSVAGGAFLAARGIGGKGHKPSLLIGAELLRRGLTGHCYLYDALNVKDAGSTANHRNWHRVDARAAVTVDKPREEVFRFWRNFENLPKIIDHLESVDARNYPRTHWIARVSGYPTIEWDAEVHQEIENSMISWRSLQGADLASAGTVHFREAPGGRGTEVQVHLKYDPPAGRVGAAIAKMLGRDPESEIEKGLMRMKQILEAGELATTDGQPVGPSKKSSNLRERRQTHPRAEHPAPEMVTL